MRQSGDIDSILAFESKEVQFSGGGAGGERERERVTHYQAHLSLPLPCCLGRVMQLRAVLADLAAAKAKETRKTLARSNEHHKKLDDIRLFLLFAHTTVFSLTRARLVGWCACSRFVLPIFSWGERLANVGNVHPKHRNALGKGSSSSRHKPHPTYVYTHKQRTFPPPRSGPIPDVPPSLFSFLGLCSARVLPLPSSSSSSSPTYGKAAAAVDCVRPPTGCV